MNKKTVPREALKKQLDDQKVQADLLKVAEGKLPPLPRIFDLLGVEGNTDAMLRVSFGDLKEDSFAQPFVITDYEQAETYVKWQGDKTSQTFISKWAGAYKKNTLFVTNHKLAQPIQDPPTLALTDALLANSFKVVKDKVELPQRPDFHTQP